MNHREFVSGDDDGSGVSMEFLSLHAAAAVTDDDGYVNVDGVTRKRLSYRVSGYRRCVAIRWMGIWFVTGGRGS